MLDPLGAVPVQIAVVGGGLLAVLAVVLAISYFRAVTGDDPSESTSGTAAVDVSVETIDELAGRTYPDADEVLARQKPTDADDSESTDDTETMVTVTGGEGEFELGPGAWRFEVREDGRTIGQRVYRIDPRWDGDRIALEVEPYFVDVRVTGGPDREPLEGATVEATADIDQWHTRAPTDPDGRAEFSVPRSASIVSFTATYGDLPPIGAEYRAEQAAEDGVELSIGAETGGIAVETTLGDTAWPEVDVRIAPDSKGARTYADEGTITTDPRGRRTVEGLPVGKYELSARPRLDGIETTAATESVTVASGEVTEVTLSIGIRYSLSDAQRERLDDLRERIAALSEAPDRDAAIPRYYGTVLVAVLGLVEEVASSPERAVEAGAAPDAAVDALLDATETGLDVVTDAMSERRVVSLFRACESMPSADVAWRGEATLADFLDRVEAGAASERRALGDRLDATGAVLDERWSDVSETAPARTLRNGVGELASEIDAAEDELAVVARGYVGRCLLDATEGLFERDALVERLDSRTL